MNIPIGFYKSRERALYYKYKALSLDFEILLELPSNTERDFAYAIV